MVVKNTLWLVVGGLAAALLVPLVAGCSSAGKCGPCRPTPPVHAGGPYAPPVADPTTLPGAPAAAALPYGGQKKCPVTGEELGSMGKPLTVTLKGETVYVCCRGCVAKAQADPDKTLAAVAAERAGR